MSAVSADDREAIGLLPIKRKKSIDWRKCIICQTDTKGQESQRKASTVGISTFLSAAKQRGDDVYRRIESEIQDLRKRDIVWHISCYKSYTSKRNLSFVKHETSTSVVSSAASVPHEVESRSSRSKVASLDWSLCMFCQKTKHKGTKVLINVTTFDAAKVIRSAADARGDDVMIHNIRDVDLIAIEAKYHSICRSSYVSKSNLKHFKDEDTEEECMYSLAFECLLEEINPGITSGRAYDMAFLLDRYKSILLENGSSSYNSYRSEKLKRRLKNHFLDSITFHKQQDPSMPELIYSSSISVQDIINAAAKQECNLQAEPQPKSVQDTSTENNTILYHAAQILRTDLKKCTGISIQPLSNDDISLENGKNVVPESLYNFLRGIFCSQDVLHKSDCSEDQEIDKRALMIGQDIVHATSHSRIKTPKHIGLAVTLHHLTGSKQIVTLLNRMGHCSSYEDVEIVNTSLATEIAAKVNDFGVIIPTNITPGVFVEFAADNNDLEEETLDGKQTTHATTLVAYQREQYGPIPAQEIHGDHSVKRRSLTAPLPLNQQIHEFSSHGKRPAVVSFQGKFKEEWYSCSKDIRSEAERKDLAWVLLRSHPCELLSTEVNDEQQSLPGWSAFNAQMSSEIAPRTKIGYCPMINGSSTEYSTIYTVLKTVQSMMSCLNQKNSVITFDLAIYMKAKEIQWRCADEFKDLVIRMGGFHIALNFLSVIGKKFKESGLEDLLIESELYGSNTTLALLKGKSYNRGVRAHKLIMEALMRLQWQTFCMWLKREKEKHRLETVNIVKITSDLARFQAATSHNERVKAYAEWCSSLDSLQTLFCQFKNEACLQSQLFQYWNSYINMVQILLRFIRSEREGDWNLHLESVAEMMPHFFAMDRTNYSRWLPVYLGDMNQLDVTAPEVHREFLQEGHSVSRSCHPFNQVWTDMALEQSVNRDSKTKGGIVGISQKADALERWFLTAHERAAITTATKAMCGHRGTDEHSTPHKEAGASRIKRDENDVRKVIQTLQSKMTNPFELGETSQVIPMTNLVTGLVMPHATALRLLNSEEVGTKQMSEFIDNRLNTNKISFWDPLPHVKIQTFASLNKSVVVKSADEKLITVNADRNLFSRCFIASRSRNVSTREVLSYELSAVPYALAHTDGTLRKTTKSILLSTLEEDVEVMPRLPVRTEPIAHIIDGMAVVQMVKTGGARTFGDLAKIYFNAITKPFSTDRCDRVDVVFDRYDKSQSIKEGERLKRGAVLGYEVKISGPNTTTPKKWQQYICNPVNKTNLQLFLGRTWIELAAKELKQDEMLVLAGCFESGKDVACVSRGNVRLLPHLESDHEEADTRIILHAQDCAYDHPRIVVQSPDTDVAILSIYAYESLMCEELWFRTGTKDKLRFIPIHTLAQKLGPVLCKLLPCFHALTGCDSTSALINIGKKRAWKALKGNQTKYADLTHIGDETPPSSNTIKVSEIFLCSLYTTSAKAGTTADEVRYVL